MAIDEKPPTLVIGADRALAAAMGFLVIYGAAALLGVEDFGVFVMAEGIRLGCMAVTDTPLGQALIHRRASQNESVEATVATALALKAVLVLALVIPCWGVAASGILPPPWRWILAVMPLWVLMSVVLTTAQQVLMAERSYHSLLILDGSALGALGLGGLVFHSHLNSPGAAMWLVACARLLSGLLVLLKKGWLILDARKSEVAPLVRYAREAFLNSLATFFNLRVDPILVGSFSGAAEAARWGLAAPVTSVYMLLGEAVNLELFPAVSALSSSRDAPGLRGVVRRTSRIWGGGSLAVTAFLILAPVAHWLPGATDLASDVTPLIWVLALAGPILVAGRIAASVNNGLGFPAHNSRATVLGLALKLSLGVALVWSLGALGAALGVFCAVAVIAMVSIILARREALFRRAP